MCVQQGYCTEEDAFDHNDLDNWVFARAFDPGRVLVGFKDQNRSFIVVLSVFNDAISACQVHVAPRDQDLETAPGELRSDPDSLPLLAEFRVIDGRVEIVAGHGLDIDLIKSWNSFVGDIDTGHCCLEEEAKQRRSAAPGV
jgi:hypothetical protein